MKIGIIGSARNHSLTIEHMRFARNTVRSIIRDRKYDVDEITLVSGGSAWMDHVAVQLFERGFFEKLVLHLPCTINPDGTFENNHEGSILNNLHKECQNKTGYKVFKELSTVIRFPNCGVITTPGFFNRNSKIASESDILIAFTFGKDTPDSNGTLNTWNKFSGEKIHISLA